MAPKMATGTIAVDPNTPPQLGQPLNFIVTTDELHGNQNPRVEFTAYDPDTQVPIATEAYPVVNGITTFNPLGGTSSQWVIQGGPAHCKALLYYWDNHPSQHQVALADLLEFDAAG